MEKSFEFKEIDLEGQETLQAISAANKFNNWMFETIRPYCSGKILEIGSGIGNISECFLKENYDITLSDIRDNYCEMLKNNLSHYPSLNEVVSLDLVNLDFDKAYAHLLGKFNTVYALNVVEHIKDHDLALKNAKKLLKTGGNVVILVPAYQAIYNKFDVELEHYRRYTSTNLKQLIQGAGFKLLHNQYFNFPGIFGWILSGSILKKKTIPKGQMKLYNILVPLFKIVDKLTFNKAGLSVVVVGQK